jgi:predicted HAD superfamily Cof-like phosphohydrolase
MEVSMSLNTETQVSPQNGNEHVVNAARAAGATTPEAEVHPAVAEFRQRFLTESRLGFLMALGEEPKEYQQMMESLLEDLQPRRGLETHLAEQMGDTFWRMRRVQNMRDGLALRSIQSKVQGEQMLATMQASKVIDMVEPFERLQEALARRGQGPTAAEIAEFVKARKGDSSRPMQEFITLLKSLHEPMEEAERKAARREARKELERLMDPLMSLGFQYGNKFERVRSPENLAALMAPQDQQSAHLQRLEDSCLRRMWRLINAFGKVRQGIMQKKDVRKVRSKQECV